MDNWYKVTMAAEGWGPDTRAQQLIDEFRDIFVGSGRPAGAAMFAQKSFAQTSFSQTSFSQTPFSQTSEEREKAREKRRQEDRDVVLFYFSGAAMAMAGTLIEAHRAVPCPAPEAGTVELVAGDASAAELLRNSQRQNS